MPKSSVSNKTLKMEIEIEDIILGIVITCAVILIITVIAKYRNINKNKNNIKVESDIVIRTEVSQNIDYTNPALGHSTKSVDGEHQFSKDEQWKSQPSKCFDCESQMNALDSRPLSVYDGTKQKLFYMK